MGKFKVMEEIREYVLANGHVASVTMGDLRVAHGSGRLGVHVVNGIRAQLAGLGLGHHPDLSTDQNEYVRLFTLGTPMAELIRSTTQPGATEDEFLRKTINERAENILQRVRELVCG